ncbi:MAG: hypothetical protein V3R89_00525 [Thermoanaerobaculia bacterium]
MLPAVALLGVGPGGWWVPIPVIVLWPLLFLALAVVGLVEAITSSGTLPRTRTLWLALCQLHGIKVDVRSATGTRVFLWVL